MQRASSKVLAQKLTDLGFKQYSKLFIDNEITGADIPYLTEAHLIEMGISLIGHRMLILKKLKEAYDGKNPEPVRLITVSQQIQEKPATIDKNQKFRAGTSPYAQQILQRPPSRDSNDDENYQRVSRKETPKISRQQQRIENKSETSESDFTTRPAKRETPRVSRTTFETKPKPREPFIDNSNDSDESSSSSEPYTKPMRVAQSKYASSKVKESSMKSDSSESSYRKSTKRDTKAIKLSDSASGSESGMRTSTPALPIQKQRESQIFKTKSESQFETSAQTTQDDSGKVVCQYCGRKFLPDAAKRHIPVCGRIRGAPSKK